MLFKEHKKDFPSVMFIFLFVLARTSVIHLRHSSISVSSKQYKGNKKVNCKFTVFHGRLTWSHQSELVSCFPKNNSSW